MSLWEQTQFAVAAIEGHGGSAQTAHVYERAVLMEMQRRLASRPAWEPFGKNADDAFPAPLSQASPRVMVMKV